MFTNTVLAVHIYNISAGEIQLHVYCMSLDSWPTCRPRSHLIKLLADWVMGMSTFCQLRHCRLSYSCCVGTQYKYIAVPFETIWLAHLLLSGSIILECIVLCQSIQALRKTVWSLYLHCVIASPCEWFLYMCCIYLPGAPDIFCVYSGLGQGDLALVLG